MAFIYGSSWPFLEAPAYCKLNLQMQKVDLRKLIVFFDLPKSSLSADVVVASFQLKAWPRVLLVRCRLVAISIGLVVN